MTSRQMGQRFAARRRRSVQNAGRRGGPRRKKNEPLAAKDLRRLVQLVICGFIFVLLVAVKLLLPAKMAAFNETLSAAMERNMDVQAVFSAVGRTFSGEGVDGVEAVYQAVFHPQSASEGQTALVSSAVSEPAAFTEARTVKLQDTAALELLRSSLAEPVPAPSAGGQGETPSNLAYVLYSQENLPEGVSMEQMILGFDYCTPVKGVLSSSFGYREHPVEGEERFHYGVDLAADTGTEVDCFADGTVTAVGESSSYGRYCVVSHDGGFSTLYAHCSRVTVSSGAAVSRGEKIAEVGQTGMATGPHLHFELQRDGDYLNPIYYVSTL